MNFELLKTSGTARRGRLTLNHGVVETPVFMPVGTYGTVKAMTPQSLDEIGAQICLGNTFHLMIRPGTEVVRLHGDLHHYSYRDMKHHLSRINEYTSIMADEYAKKGRRAHLSDMAFRPGFNFVKKYFFQRGFLDGAPGFVICVLAAYYVFLKYAKLWERQRSAS